MAHLRNPTTPLDEILARLRSTGIKTIVTDLSHDPPLFQLILWDGHAINANAADIERLYRAGVLPDEIVRYLVSMGVI